MKNRNEDRGENHIKQGIFQLFYKNFKDSLCTGNTTGFIN